MGSGQISFIFVTTNKNLFQLTDPYSGLFCLWGNTPLDPIVLGVASLRGLGLFVGGPA